MKKFLAIFCTTFLVTISSSYATGLFVGADALLVNSNYSGLRDGSSNRLSYGVNAGYRVDFITLLASAELFYDDLNIARDQNSLNNRYGVKANLGFKILPNVSPFVTFGLANVNYGNFFSSNGSISRSEFTPLYGVGVLIDLPMSFSVKIAYDYQQFDMRYTRNGTRIGTDLGVARLGVIYNF